MTLPLLHLGIRLVVFALILILALIQIKVKKKWLIFLRFFYPFALLTYAYDETATFNMFFFHQPLDNYFVIVDKWIFGFQPAIEFSKHFPQHWFGELLYMSYFSYYFILLVVGLSFFFFRYIEAEKTIFILITSFYIYYLIFIFLPVVGPQYYFTFPMNKPPHTGFFSNAVQWVQSFGEKPTGAFPSSHVGIAVIYLMLTYNNFKKLYYLLLPFVVLILFATVYIKAHYAIDVVGGLISAPLLYYFSKWLWQKAQKLNLSLGCIHTKSCLSKVNEL